MTLPPQLTFMAGLTVLLLVTIQGASIYMLVTSAITARDYLGVWSPIMTLAMGYWFGKQGGAQ